MQPFTINLQLRAWRQLGTQLELSGFVLLLGLWEDLFYGYDLTRPITIELRGRIARSLAISRAMDSIQVVR